MPSHRLSPRRRVAASPRHFSISPSSLLRAGTEFFVELFDERKLAGGFVIAPQPPERQAKLVMGIRTVGRDLHSFLQRVDGFGKLFGLNQGAAQRPVGFEARAVKRDGAFERAD